MVMFNGAWCKKYIHSLRCGSTIDGYRVFLSGHGGSGKSDCVSLIQRDMSYFLSQVLNADPDQPFVLVTAPTGSAAFQIGGTTNIHSAFLLYEGSTRKPNWEKQTIMQLKLEHIMLSVTDEISMVGFTPFQQMNETICQIKGTSDGNWGNICVLAVGDLYQLPPVAQCPVYMQPHNINTLNDFASNGWKKMQLHELTQVMRQNDMAFVQCLNNMWTKVPEPGSPEDIMLQACELKVGPDDETYSKHAMHVYAENVHCNVWNNFMLSILPGQEFVIPAIGGKRDVSANLAKV